jgi:hypothetical protein
VSDVWKQKKEDVCVIAQEGIFLFLFFFFFLFFFYFSSTSLLLLLLFYFLVYIKYIIRARPRGWRLNVRAAPDAPFREGGMLSEAKQGGESETMEFAHSKDINSLCTRALLPDAYRRHPSSRRRASLSVTTLTPTPACAGVGHIELPEGQHIECAERTYRMPEGHISSCPKGNIIRVACVE